MLQLCLTWQLSSRGLSIIHIHEGDVRELLGAVRNNCRAFLAPVPPRSTFSDRMSCLSFPTGMQPLQTQLVEIHEKNPQHLEKPNQYCKAASIFARRGSDLLTQYLALNYFKWKPHVFIVQNSLRLEQTSFSSGLICTFAHILPSDDRHLYSLARRLSSLLPFEPFNACWQPRYSVAQVLYLMMLVRVAW